MGLLSLFNRKSAPPETPAIADAPAEDQATVSSATPSAEIWRRSDFFSFPAGDEQHVVSLRGSLPFSMPSFAVDFLFHCVKFRSLEEHLDEYAGQRDWSPMQVNSLTSWLPRMIETGLLISSEKVRALCAAAVDPTNRPPTVRVIGFPVGGPRTAMLERCLLSFGDSLARHGRETELLVTDSSTQPEHRAAFRTLLQQLHRERGFRLRYAGEEEKQKFARALIEKSGCRPSSVEFALFDPHQAGFACGANRNALLLHEAGTITVSVDDDVLCEMAPIPSSESRVSLFSHGDPCHREFFPDRESALAAAEFQDIDFLGAHESMLGHDVGDFFSAGLRAEEVDLSNADDDILRRIEKQYARIRTTYFGQLGDPGTPTSCYYFYLKGKNLARLTTSEELYRAAFANRSVLAGVPHPAIGGGYLAPGMTIGLDHRELLPPFFPVLHAEDMIFAAAAAHCCARSVSGHLPIALHHDSGKNKALHQPMDLTAGNRVTIFEFATVMRALLAHCAPPEHPDPAERMRVLGHNLCAFAQRPSEPFLEAYRQVVLRMEADEISFMEELLREETDAPDYWRRDIENFISHTRQALEHEDFDIPLELKPQRSDEANRRLMQQLILSYGELLEDWPGIVAAARDLRESGFEFSSPVRA